MPLYRFYVDRENGSEHSRVFDTHAVDEDQARGMLELEEGETENSVVTLDEGGIAPPLDGEALRDFYIRQLEELGYDVPNELKVAQVVNPGGG